MCRRRRILDKILSNVDVAGGDECWNWKGRDSGKGRGGGYPRMELDGQTVAVLRVLYTHFHGYIPSKKQVDHTCENRRCLNPRHLELVTHKENQRRRSRRRKGSVEGPSDILTIDIEELIAAKQRMGDEAQPPGLMVMSPETFVTLGGNMDNVREQHEQESDVDGTAQGGGGDRGASPGVGQTGPVSGG